MHKARPMLIGQGKYKTRSGRASWGTARSGLKNKLFSYIAEFRRWSLSSGKNGSKNGISTKVKIKLLLEVVG